MQTSSTIKELQFDINPASGASINSSPGRQPATSFKRREPLILIVEDDPTLEPLWAYIIEKVHPRANYVWAQSEIEAEDYIDLHQTIGRPFDLVIADIFLSGQRTGIDLWQKYDSDLTGKFLLVSGIKVDKYHKLFSSKAFVPQFIQKPLIPQECIETVYTILKSAS